jgi:nucleotide-binding universal stress UspA family protein
MRVLFAVDGSAGSFGAIGQVAPLLKPDRDQVALYCRPPEFVVRSGHVEKGVLATVRDGLANAVFTEAGKRLPAQLRENLQPIIGQQDPRYGINVAAEQWSANLIVMGARGLNVLGRLVLGSVSRAVVHAAKCPVWIGRPRPRDALQTPRVLVACECAESGKNLVEVLDRLAWPEGTGFTAVTVVPSIFAGRVPDWLQQQARSAEVEAMAQAWAREHDEDLRTRLASLQAFVEGLAPPLRAMRPVVEEGEPAHLILETAASESSTLVVVGTRRSRSLGSIILGSTSEAVLNHADCSVLVVPHWESP